MGSKPSKVKGNPKAPAPAEEERKDEEGPVETGLAKGTPSLEVHPRTRHLACAQYTGAGGRRFIIGEHFVSPLMTDYVQSACAAVTEAAEDFPDLVHTMKTEVHETTSAWVSEGATTEKAFPAVIPDPNTAGLMWSRTRKILNREQKTPIVVPYGPKCPLLSVHIRKYSATEVSRLLERARYFVSKATTAAAFFKAEEKVLSAVRSAHKCYKYGLRLGTVAEVETRDRSSIYPLVDHVGLSKAYSGLAFRSSTIQETYDLSHPTGFVVSVPLVIPGEDPFFVDLLGVRITCEHPPAGPLHALRNGRITLLLPSPERTLENLESLASLSDGIDCAITGGAAMTKREKREACEPALSHALATWLRASLEKQGKKSGSAKEAGSYPKSYEALDTVVAKETAYRLLAAASIHPPGGLTDVTTREVLETWDEAKGNLGVAVALIRGTKT